MDENAKEYIVKSINSSENKVVIQHKKKSSLKTIALKQKKNNKEEEFLYSINLFTSENKEVA
jgi:CRISPR/Cas system CMR-associated protein Cmr3 (group 5 of RAMP superfamily)